ATWPPAGAQPRGLDLQEAAATNGTDLAVEGDVGTTGSIWCAADLPFGIPWDQREDEARSLVFEWRLGDALEIVGHPRVELTLTPSSEVAFVSAKLCCVHPDGASELVTRAIFNLTHRDGHEAVAPLEPGEPVRVRFDLDATAFAFPAGARVRLDLAGSDFPSSWPPPQAGTLAVDPASSRLVLPAVGPAALPPPVFEEGEARAHRPGHVAWEVRDDVIARTRAVSIDHGGDRAVSGGMRDAYKGEIAVRRDDPADTRASGEVMFALTWPEADVRTESRGTLRTDRDAWHLELELDVYEGGETLRRRRWERHVARYLQ
ncbi:MAG: CocE/NonD family hydrolase C-terminal non-catalytic domain-containing protein, partial [Actinomycetota bacterium]